MNKATQDLWDKMKTDPSTPYRLVIKALVDQYKGIKVTEEMLEELGVRERLSDKEVIVKIDPELKAAITQMKVHRAQPDAEILAYITDHFAYDGKRPPSPPPKEPEPESEPEPPKPALKKPTQEPQQARVEETVRIKDEVKVDVKRQAQPPQPQPQPEQEQESEQEPEEEEEEIEFPTDAYKVRCPHCNAPLVITVSSLANAMAEEEEESQEQESEEEEEDDDE